MIPLIIFTVIVILIVVTIVALFIVSISAMFRSDSSEQHDYLSESDRYGMYGERLAADLIQGVIREDDILFTNVSVAFDNQATELDNVIVNKYGVFIIEVKNYKGTLYGNEDDFEWLKVKTDPYGNSFEKNVKNPIRQVKRQTHILANYLRHQGANVWVEGYALLLHGNSPVDSKYLLSDVFEIDKAIHTYGKTWPSAQTIEIIKALLSAPSTPPERPF